ncbi:Uncharacterised protein [Chlamydia trachomatis]|nr:Uncharacterised protein [Chlamydia trachomatis]
MLGAGIAWLFYDRYFFQLLLVLLMISVICLLVAHFCFDETRSDGMTFEHGHGLFSTLKNYRQVLVDKPFVIYTLGSIGTSIVWLQVDNFSRLILS